MNIDVARSDGEGLLVHIAKIRSFQAGAVSIVRMTSDLSNHEESRVLPQSEAHNIILQLKPFEKHRLWRSGNLVYEGGYADGALAITDMSEEWRCHHRSSFDNIRFQFPRQVLSEFARDAGFLRFARLSEQSGKPEKVVPFLVEDELISLGAIFSKVKDWGVHTVVDGQLITGQNPASSHKAAEALVTAVNQYRANAA